jgi:hypothetical protein
MVTELTQPEIPLSGSAAPVAASQSLKPVKKIYLKELIDSVVVIKLSTAFLKMLNPVEACVPDI